MGLLDGLINRIFKGDAAGDDAADEANLVPATKAIRFVNATVTHVPGKRRTDVTFAGGEGGEGGPALSDVAPPALGTAAAGNATTAARGNHVHAHGDQAGGSLHANATTAGAGAAGFMSAADKAKLDGVASGATANAGTVTSVSGSGGISVANGTTTPAISIADGALALAKLANLTALRVIGSIAGGAPAELTPTQVTASLVEDATTSLPGRLSAAFWQLLNGATAAESVATLVRRPADGAAAPLCLRGGAPATPGSQQYGGICVGVGQEVAGENNNGLIFGEGAPSGGLPYTTARSRINTVSGQTRWQGGFLQCNFTGVVTFRGEAGTTIGYTAATSTTTIRGDELGIEATSRRVEMRDGAALPRVTDRYPVDAQTTNATTTTAAMYTATSRGGKIKRVIRARTATASASWTFYYDARLLSGAAAWTGGDAPVAVDFAADAALAACQCELDLSGTGVRSRVTGIAATTIDWSDNLEDRT